MRLLAFAMLALLLTGDAGAATFVLRDGGRIEGELINADESPRTAYIVKTSAGLQVTLAADRVKQVITPKPAELEYEQIRHTYADTVDGQWSLSEWCRDHNLIDARQTALRRILELDTDHAQARALLGYTRVDGAWKTQREAMQDRGFVEYGGKWMLPQEAALREQDKNNEVNQRAWFAKIKMWRGWLDDAGRRDDALANLRAVQDPAAIPAIKQQLETDSVDGARLMFVDVLAGIDAPASRDLLANVAVADTADEVRLTALDHLVRTPQPESVRFFIQKLKDKDNQIVNRAALALGRLKDPSAIEPLIDALITKHKFRIVTGPPAGSTSAAFSQTGGGGFSTGGGGPKEFTKQLMNTAALDALAAITGHASYGYDQALWKKWYATQRPSAGLDARRD